MPGTVLGLGYTEINGSNSTCLLEVLIQGKEKNPDDYNVISAIINR